MLMMLKGPLMNISGTLLGSEISIGPVGGRMIAIGITSHSEGDATSRDVWQQDGAEY
jgi:hypothetical protein